jgi:tetratricopeptide (TPR) repeat protein
VALKFKFLDVPISIGVDFLVVMLVLGALWRTPEQLPLWMVVVTGAVLIHEMGHATISDFLGFKPVIRLYGGGGLTLTMSTDGRGITPRQHIAIAAAGPIAGLILGGGVGLAVLAAPRISSNDVVQDLLWVSLGWSAVNLLPFPGVDGGSIVTELTAIFLGRPAEALGRTVGLVVVGAILVGLVLAGLYDWAFIVGVFAVINTARIGFRAGGLGGRVAPQSPGQLLMEGRYQEAFNLARVEMTDHPTDVGPILTASDALRLMGRYSDSEWGYDKVVAFDPANSRALRGRAFTRRHLGRDAEADADIAALLALPRDGAVVPQAAALYDADRHADGYRLTCESLSTTQSPVLLKVLRSFVAMFEYSLGREDEALSHIEPLVGAFPDDAALLEQRALILVDLGRFPEAIVDARKALAMKPQHPSYLETFGLAARMSGDAAAALQALILSTEARPSDPRARAELALCQVQLGRLGEARAALETLPGYARRDPFAAYAQAAVLAASGAGDTAIGFLREASRLRPELGVRAGVDPLFQTLLADPTRRAALVATNTSAMEGAHHD